MAGTVKMNKSQLMTLIDETKANGGDSEELEGLLQEVEAEEGQTNQWRPRPRRRGARSERVEEEETMLERLSREVGDLFPAGITDELLEEVIAYDSDHTLAEIRKECQEAGFSTSGHKKKLAARLIAARMRK